MFKRIVVAVDASPTGDLALETAIRLAADHQSRLRIVHAVDTVSINLGVEFPVQPDVSESIVSSGQTLLEHAQKVATAAGVAAETALLRIDLLGKRLAEAIAEDAESWPADLIVVGTHGRRGLNRLFLGSVAEGIVRVAGKPVLLIRGK
jgi:nucleotide-binding universal stress UspA family protein